jgi:hypothetical protein
MKLKLVPALPNDKHVGVNTGIWTCNVCTSYGTGGTNGFSRHYLAHHYEVSA